MRSTQLKELLLQALEHERGGVLVYQTALECALNRDLHEEWKEYLQQTTRHVEILTELCTALELDPREMTPGCKIVRQLAKALVGAMKSALAESDAAAAELVACDCVVLAETRDHANWQLIGECAKASGKDATSLLWSAYESIEDEEDEHLYHSQGWARELWLKSLGLPARLPPPEEKEDVTSATAAAEAREESLADRKH